MKRTLELIALGVTAAGAIAGVAASYIILPYRCSTLEKEQAAMKKQIADAATASSADRELLVRIEERVKSVQETLDVRIAK